MKIKSKIDISLIGTIILIFIISLFIYKAIAASTIDVEDLIDAAKNDEDLFWSAQEIMTGQNIDETGIESSKNSTLWICFSHKKLSSSWGRVQEVKSIVNINTHGYGTYVSRTKGVDGTKVNSGVVDYGDDISATRASIIRQLDYLLYAATVDSSYGLVGREDSSNSKNALYYYLNHANLKFLMGDFVKKQTDDYEDDSYAKGKKILEYAERYADSETDAGSTSSDITSSKDEDATITIQVGNDDNTYSYVGPFSIKSNGDIKSVTLKTGSDTHKIAGYASKVGYIPKDITNLPTNGNQFYILTSDILNTESATVKITTTGTTGGGTIINPKTKEKVQGYIKSKIIFMGNTSGQATAVFKGKIVKTETTTDSVTLTASTTLGKLVLKKIGAYAGDNNYESIKNVGYKIYYLDGTTKKYVRINDLDEIKEQNTIIADDGTIYDADENSATTIYTIEKRYSSN